MFAFVISAAAKSCIIDHDVSGLMSIIFMYRTNFTAKQMHMMFKFRYDCSSVYKQIVFQWRIVVFFYALWIWSKIFSENIIICTNDIFDELTCIYARRNCCGKFRSVAIFHSTKSLFRKFVNKVQVLKIIADDFLYKSNVLEFFAQFCEGFKYFSFLFSVCFFRILDI